MKLCTAVVRVFFLLPGPSEIVPKIKYGEIPYTEPRILGALRRVPSKFHPSHGSSFQMKLTRAEFSGVQNTAGLHGGHQKMQHFRELGSEP